jgi:hypothetical protein
MTDFINDILEQVKHIRSIGNAFGAENAMEDLTNMLNENYTQLLDSFGESQSNQARLIRDGLQVNAALTARINELEVELEEIKRRFMM